MVLALSGKHGWEQTFCAQFGEHRWKRLKKALKYHVESLCYHPDPRIAATTEQYSHCDAEEFRKKLVHVNLHESGIPHCYVSALSLSESSAVISTQLPLVYFIDAASCVAAHLLGVRPGEKVLDYCAAPGGKSLILGSILFPAPSRGAALPHSGPSSLLVCHDASSSRLERLRINVTQRLPYSAVTTKSVRILSSRKNVELLGPYDRILLDAPCSTDRHVLNDPSKLALWRLRDVKTNAKRQLDLLKETASLLKTASRDARLLYCTCALSVEENDRVVERFLKKQKGKKLCAVSPHALVNECRARVPTLNIQLTSHAHSSPDSESSKEELVLSKHGAQRDFIIRAEATEYGVFFLPDVSGYGPLFVSALQWAEDQSDAAVL